MSLLITFTFRTMAASVSSFKRLSNSLWFWPILRCNDFTILVISLVFKIRVYLNRRLTTQIKQIPIHLNISWSAHYTRFGKPKLLSTIIAFSLVTLFCSRWFIWVSEILVNCPTRQSLLFFIGPLHSLSTPRYPGIIAQLCL